MMRRLLVFAPLIYALVACGAAAPSAYEMPPSEVETREAELSPAIQPPASAPAVGDQANLPPASDFVLLFTPAPTDTVVPPLELPLLEAGAPPVLTWDGQPTYLAESQPGYFFRMQYDPEVWAQTRDVLGFTALGHRSIPYCVIAPSSGRGLPLNAVVEHETRKLGEFTYEVNTVFVNGQIQLVTYVGGDGLIVTGFEVVFQGSAQACLSDAEVVLETLQAIPQLQATIVP